MDGGSDIISGHRYGAHPVGRTGFGYHNLPAPTRLPAPATDLDDLLVKRTHERGSRETLSHLGLPLRVKALLRGQCPAQPIPYVLVFSPDLAKPANRLVQFVRQYDVWIAFRLCIDPTASSSAGDGDVLIEVGVGLEATGEGVEETKGDGVCLLTPNLISLWKKARRLCIGCAPQRDDAQDPQVNQGDNAHRAHPAVSLGSGHP